MSKPQASNLSAEELAWKLAGAKNKCAHQGTIATALHSQIREPAELCSKCKDTNGLVYVLPDSVRIPCNYPSHPEQFSSELLQLLHGTWCFCRGLGYTPSMNLEVWLLGLWSFGYRVTYWTADYLTVQDRGVGQQEVSVDGEPLESLLRALAAVLEAQGVKL